MPQAEEGDRKSCLTRELFMVGPVGPLASQDFLSHLPHSHSLQWWWTPGGESRNRVPAGCVPPPLGMRVHSPGGNNRPWVPAEEPATQGVTRLLLENLMSKPAAPGRHYERFRHRVLHQASECSLRPHGPATAARNTDSHPILVSLTARRLRPTFGGGS